MLTRLILERVISADLVVGIGLKRQKIALFVVASVAMVTVEKLMDLLALKQLL